MERVLCSSLPRRREKLQNKEPQSNIRTVAWAWESTFLESDCCFLCHWHSSPSTFYLLPFYHSTYNRHPFLWIQLWKMWKVKYLQIRLKHQALSLSWLTWSTLTGSFASRYAVQYDDMHCAQLHTYLPGYQKQGQKISYLLFVIWQRWTTSPKTGPHTSQSIVKNGGFWHILKESENQIQSTL